MLNRKLRLEQEVGIFGEYSKRGVTVIEPSRESFAAPLKFLQDAVKPELMPLLQRIRAA